MTETVFEDAQVVAERKPGTAPRHAQPFTASHERKWPRAGVRRKADGFWALVVWAAPDVSIAYYVGVSFGSREEAVDLGATLAGAHRSEGVIEAVS